MISVQIGQCGNQLGIEWWSQLLCLPELSTSTQQFRQAYTGYDGWLTVRNEFLNDDGTARMVAVDSEPKVVQSAASILNTLCRIQYGHNTGPASQVKGYNTGDAVTNDSLVYNGAGSDSLFVYNNIGTNNTNQPLIGHTNTTNGSKQSKSISSGTRANDNLPQLLTTYNTFQATSMYNPTTVSSHYKHPHARFTSDNQMSNTNICTFDKYLRDKQTKYNSSTSNYNSYNASSFIYEQCGRGNNWALGFYGGSRKSKTKTPDHNNPIDSNTNNTNNNNSNSSNNNNSSNRRQHFSTDTSQSGSGRGGIGLLTEDSPNSLSSLTINSIRKQMERCDEVHALLLFHSISGGTGSGLGSRLTVEIKDELCYKSQCLNIVTTPFSSGEVVLQHYNNIMSLHTIEPVSDGIWMCSNQDYMNVMDALNTQTQKNMSSNNSNNNGKGNSSKTASSGPNNNDNKVNNLYDRLLGAKINNTNTSNRHKNTDDVDNNSTVSNPITKSMLSSLSSYNNINNYIASTLIDFLCPTYKMSPESLTVIRDGITPETALSSASSPASYASSSGLIYNPASSACSVYSNNYNISMNNSVAFTAHSGSVIPSGAAFECSISSMMGVYEGYNPNNTNPKSSSSSSSSYHPNLSPSWRSVHDQLNMQLLHLCPSKNTKFIEIWSTGGLIRCSSSASTNSTGGGNGNVQDWRKHCEVLTRYLPRTLHSSTDDSPPNHSNSAGISLTSGNQLWNDSIVTKNSLLNLNPNECDRFNERLLDIRYQDISTMEVSNVFNRSLAISSIMHNANPYSNSNNNNSNSKYPTYYNEIGMYYDNPEISNDKIPNTLARICNPVKWREDAVKIVHSQCPSYPVYYSQHANQYINNNPSKSSASDSQRGNLSLSHEFTPRSITVGLNRGRSAWNIAKSVYKSSLLLSQNAYIHWYEQYGCSREDMYSSIEYCNDIVDHYYQMLK